MPRPGSFHTGKLSQQIKGKFKTRKNTCGVSGDDWLGHGLAQWAVNSTVVYADAVFSTLGVRPYYDHVRSKFGTADDADDP